MRVATLCLLCAGACAPAVGVPPGPAAPSPSAYRFLATAESADEVVLAEFVPCAGTPGEQCGVRTVRTYDVGYFATDIEGPHGVIPIDDGTAMLVSLAHGRPAGSVQKIDLETGRSLGSVKVGMYAATIDAGAGGLGYVINFNFEDPEMRPSSLSVVDGEALTEIARIETCRMPHGSRLNPAGTRHYSGCMMNDLLVEVDVLTLTVSRTLFLPVAGAAPDAHAGHGTTGDPDAWPMSNACSPTWAQPSADGAKVYVACNKSAEILEVDVDSWTIARRWATPKAPYNLAVTPDGRLLVATQKGPGSVTIWRLSDLAMLVDIPGTRGVASGIVTSADSRFAFATMEGKGGEPGTVDIIDLRGLTKVASLDMGKQAGGIAMLP